MTAALLLMTCYLITSLLFFADFLLEYPHLMPPFLRRRWHDYCFRRTVRRFLRRDKLVNTAVAVRRKGILRRVPRYTRKIPYLQGHADRRYWRDIGEKLHEIALQYPQKSVEWLPDDEVKANARRLNLAHLGGLVQPPAPKILRQRLRYTRHIPVLQGEQLLAFERGQELLFRNDKDETGEAENENETETVTEAVVVPDAKKLEAVREEEEEEGQDSEEDCDFLMERFDDELVGDDKAVDGEAVDNESVGKDEAVEDKGAIEEEQVFDNEAVEEENVTVLPIKKIQPPRAPLRRSPRLGGAMGSVFIVSKTGRVLRRSARTMKSHPF